VPGFLHLLRCVGKAVVKNAGKALASLVPFGEFAYDVAKDAYEDYSKESREAQLRAELQDLAQAPQAEVRQAVEEVAAHEAAGQPAEVRLALVAYLTQLPASIRQSLRRPTDPGGTTVPAGLPLKKPEDLLPFLPAGLPRFKPGDRPLAADWELVEMLGKGGFGEVWKARHLTRSRQKPVALKFCLDPVAADTLRHEAALHDHLDRVREEASLPGIIPLLETYLRADPPCLMYELIEGGDLGGLIQEMKERGGSTQEFASKLVRRLASILAPAHGHGLVHRDLKPSNVLVQRREGNNLRLFVADFGIGGLVAERSIQEQTNRRTIPRTMPTVVRGAYTPLYASPQQVAGEKPDPRDDVHALGVIWYQLLTGDMRLAAVPPDWREVVEEKRLGEELVRLLASCLSSRLEKRPANAGQLAERLEGVPKAVPAETGSGRKAVTEVRPEAVREIEVSVPGEWSARPANDPTAGWTAVRKTPGQVSVRPHEVYHLTVSDGVTDRQLVGLGHLRSLTSLQSLNLLGCKLVTDAGLAHLRGLTALRSLDLWECERVTDAGLAHLRGLTALRSLDLWGGEQVTDAGLAHLRGLNALRHLNLQDCRQVTDAGLAHLRGLTALQCLMLGGMKFTDAGLAHLPGLTALHSLSLTGCDQFTDAGVAHLRGVPALKNLCLSFCKQFTDAGLAHLSGLNALHKLDLGWCKQVTDAGLAHLQGLTALKNLCLRYCDQVTDAGLAHLCGLTALQDLELGRCKQVTDAGLAHLRGLTALKNLYLWYCDQVTDAGIASLQQAIPSCKINK
jgi:hypothetical protein